MAETVIAYTKDGMWHVDLVAFMLNDFVYKVIRLTIRAYHWEVGGALWWHQERWVEKSVDFLSVQNTYEGILPSTQPGNALQGNSAENASACDCRQWAFGVSGTSNVDLNTGSLSTAYKYLVVDHDASPGYEQPRLDNSGFSLGDAGFGDPKSYCSLNTPTYVKTNWPEKTDILVRKQFTLPSGSRNLEVRVAIDNDVQVFINSQDISRGLCIHEGCPEHDSFVFTASDNLLLAGANLLAVRGRDLGGPCYLDVQVTAATP